MRLSSISLFSTGPKLYNFCAKKILLLFQAPSLLGKSCLRFWSHSLLPTDFLSGYTGRIRNELRNAAGLMRLFSAMNAKLLKLSIICSRKISVFVCKSAVDFSAPHFRLVPLLWLLWQRHCLGGGSKMNLKLIPRLFRDNVTANYHKVR